MKITLKNIKVADLAKDYEDKSEQGVRGYEGRLNIRPAYQIESAGLAVISCPSH